MVLSIWRNIEPTRAFAAVLWLLVPVSVAALYPDVATSAYYAGVYTLVVAMLLAARYLARRYNPQVPTAGLSYAVGAVIAAITALSIAPFAQERLLAATVALAVAVAGFIASRFIEKRSWIMVVLPVVAQVGLWSTYVDGQLLLYSALSAAVAALGYYGLSHRPEKSEGFYVQQASLVMAYVPVMVYFGAAASGAMVWVLPWTVLLAAATTLHAVWRHSQGVRESVGAFVSLAIMVVLHFYGLRNFQVYAHIVAATLAVYAYWRWRRREHRQSDGYIMATLATVTVPLALQAMIGMAGDLYGWWLLIEHVGIMLLGMVLHKKLMIHWGLWTAMAAVLYQLRHLGWAALSFLAIFLIGLALFRLQRSDRDTASPPEK